MRAVNRRSWGATRCDSPPMLCFYPIKTHEANRAGGRRPTGWQHTAPVDDLRGPFALTKEKTARWNPLMISSGGNRFLVPTCSLSTIGYTTAGRLAHLPGSEVINTPIDA